MFLKISSNEIQMEAKHVLFYIKIWVGFAFCASASLQIFYFHKWVTLYSKLLKKECEQLKIKSPYQNFNMKYFELMSLWIKNKIRQQNNNNFACGLRRIKQ